jgi:hypothetical protein
LRTQAWNYVILCLTAAVLIVAVRALTWLNNDVTAIGVIVNCFSVLIAVGIFGFLARLIQNAYSRQTAMTLRESFYNSAVLSAVVLCFNYGSLIFLFNWPYSTERSIPENFENAAFTSWLGLALCFLSLVLWLAGLFTTIFGVKTSKGWRLDFSTGQTPKSN